MSSLCIYTLRPLSVKMYISTTDQKTRFMLSCYNPECRHNAGKCDIWYKRGIVTFIICRPPIKVHWVNNSCQTAGRKITSCCYCICINRHHPLKWGFVHEWSDHMNWSGCVTRLYSVKIRTVLTSSHLTSCNIVPKGFSIWSRYSGKTSLHAEEAADKVEVSCF